MTIADSRLLVEGSPGYDQARTVWNAMVDRRPRAIVRCASADDAADAIRYGRERDLEIGVRCGGHSVLGLGVPDGGLMIDLSPMGGVRVDPGRRRARVEGGALLGALDRAAMAHDLATTAGNVSHTGVGGLTLGGRMGWLARRLGLSCDNAASYELITADGERLHVDEAGNPELFWGLRGGGGNFGVVTEFEFRLHPIASRAHVVELFFAIEEAAPVLRGWRDLNAIAPREATFTAWVGESRSLLLPREWRSGPSPASGSCGPANVRSSRSSSARCVLSAARSPSEWRSSPTWSCSGWTTRSTGMACAATGRATTSGRCRTRRSTRSCCAARPTGTASG
jgi:FAD/FMN-containing dehydrogenase